MVFQSYALYPHMTVYQNLAFGLELRRVPAAEIQRRVEAAARKLGISELLERKPRALSGGQRQRVAMGRAIVREPSVFLFDEPLSNLDARLRHEVRLEIARLHRELGTTMVYVTHDQIEAMTLADRIAVMDQGRLMQCGTPLELYHRPDNRFVAGFIGSPAMNFLGGRFETAAGRTEFRAGLLAVPVASEANRAAMLGIRPEHLTATADGGPWSIEHLEHMGVETLAHATHDGTRLTVRLPGDSPLRLGDRATVAADPRHAHFFDEAGVRLSVVLSNDGGASA
jgi:ABC-type sugar transport system ATPase subunit